MIESTVLLFLVIDPFGNLPFVLAVLGTAAMSAFRRIIVWETFLAFVVPLVFAMAGLPVFMVICMIFLMGRRIHGFLGEKGGRALEKFMGLLLNLVAVNRILVGIRETLMA